MILVDSKSPSGGQCSVAVDDVLGGGLAVSHLPDAGYHRVTYIGGPLTLRQVSDRRDGAIRALEGAGLTADELQIIETPAPNVAAGRLARESIGRLPARQRPTAAFSVNDLIALGLLQTMTRLGIRVPEDLAIVGYDDIDFVAAAAVPLSSVCQPRHELGRTAAQLLLEEAREAGTHKHRQVIFDPELVVRRSSQRQTSHRSHIGARTTAPGGRARGPCLNH